MTSPPSPVGCFFASAALRLCVFSCGARRLARRRSLSSAALALIVVFPLASAAGLCLYNTGDGPLRCPDPVYPSEIHALQEEHRRLMEALKLTVNHIARLERLLGFLSPEEQLIIDRMLINPYKNCTLDLMETLHLEKSQIYNLRAGAMKKLLRLRYGACASADAIQASNRAERGS